MSVLTFAKAAAAEQELISPELVEKYENKEIVMELLNDYSQDELKRADIVHPTKQDPVAILDNEPIAMWL